MLLSSSPSKQKMPQLLTFLFRLYIRIWDVYNVVSLLSTDILFMPGCGTVFIQKKELAILHTNAVWV